VQKNVETDFEYIEQWKNIIILTTTYKNATDFKKSANGKPVPGQGGRG
jgi:hypothetical protein